jgi:hypothetical protein
MGAGGSRICGPSQPPITDANTAVKHATRDFTGLDVETEEQEKKYHFEGAPDVTTTIDGRFIASNLQEIWTFFVKDLENKAEVPREMAENIILHVVSRLKKKVGCCLETRATTAAGSSSACLHTGPRLIQTIEDMPDLPARSSGEEQIDIQEYFQDKDTELAKAILKDFENTSGDPNLQFDDYMTLTGRTFIDLLSKHDSAIPDLENLSLRRYHSSRDLDKSPHTPRGSSSVPKTPRMSQRGSTSTALYLQEVGVPVSKS